MKVKEIFGKSLKYSLNLRNIFYVFAVNYLIGFFYYSLLKLLGAPSEITKLSSFVEGLSALGLLSITTSSYVISTLSLSIVTCIISDNFSRITNAEGISRKKSGRTEVVKRFFSVFLTYILILLLLVAPLLLIWVSRSLVGYAMPYGGIFGIMLAVLWGALSFMAPIISWFEKLNPFEAIQKSINLIRKNKLETAKFLVSYQIILGFILIAYVFTNRFISHWAVLDLFKSFTMLFTISSWTFYYFDKRQRFVH